MHNRARRAREGKCIIVKFTPHCSGVIEILVFVNYCALSSLPCRNDLFHEYLTEITDTKFCDSTVAEVIGILLVSSRMPFVLTRIFVLFFCALYYVQHSDFIFFLQLRITRLVRLKARLPGAV